MAVCWALGSLLLQSLRIRLPKWEYGLLSSAAGAAVLSVLIFVLCACGIAYVPVFLVMGIGLIASHYLTRPARSVSPPVIELTKTWQLTLTLVMALYGVVYLVRSLAPEISPDGATYHLVLSTAITGNMALTG